MCGIAGLRKFGADVITEDHIRALLLALEHRGTDATGIAIKNGAEIFVHKDDEPAWQFLGNKATTSFINDHLTDVTDTVLLHTRAATQGSPRKAENNHPLTAGKTVVIHNGCLTNDDFLFKAMKLTRNAETDSDIIRAILDQEGFTPAGIRELNRLGGSAAVAAISPEAPEKLFLARSGNPLIYCVTDGNLLMWASTKEALHHASRNWEERLNGIWVQTHRVDLKWGTMPDNTAYIFGAKGLEHHEKFNVAYQYTAPRYRCYDTYQEKQELWDKDIKAAAKKHTKTASRPAMIVCPACDKTCTWPEDLRDKEPWELTCFYCKALLGTPPRNPIVEGELMLSQGNA